MKRSGPYHHGDLRNALIDAAATIVELRGLNELSLRAAARRAGVSQTAPYRHFKDKEALIAAVAADGFLMLAEDLDAAAAQSRDLVLIGKSYVRFALEHPARFQLMFGRDISHRSAHDVLADAEEHLRTLFHRLSPQGQSEALWAAFHGLADLCVGGLLDLAEENLQSEDRLDHILETVLAGFSALGDG